MTRFAAAVQRAPQAIALLQNDAELTYAELDEHSNRLAHYLRRQAVGQGDLVAILGHRSIATVTAILAVLKAGAAYVPLDTGYPAELLRFMMSDCAPALVLALDHSLANKAFAAPVMDIQTALAAAAAEPGTPLKNQTAPGDPAYVMYTSGSTGRPKGVTVPHRAVLRLISDQSFIHFGPDEVFLHAAPLAFDASTLEIWGALLHGARLAILPSARPSLQDIVGTIARHRVTTAWFTAGLFHLLVDQKLEGLLPLRQLVAGGDVLSPSHVQRALAALAGCRIVNGYGPTENTTFTCCYDIPRQGWGSGSVPIGIPITHTYIRLLNDDMKSVADGDVGQLCAGGDGLALGYWGDERQTSEKFVADPYAQGSRLYLTGDLARRRPDGALEFIGRRDRQAKIDGKRVELGEIEEGLRRNPAIADAIVVMRDDGNGVRRLTAYAKPRTVSANAHTFGQDALARLRLELPAHMIPSVIMVLEEFPLTPNGKVDTARLPAFRLDEPAIGASTRNTSEETLSGIFRRILRLPGIGLDSNFFDLGATSLNLLEAHEEIARRFGDVDVIALFEHPNIRDLAAYLSAKPSARRDGRQAPPNRQAEALKRLRAAKSR
ncbi:MAG TPA: non-ribosomal peptide synthetase [Rhizomicrobium sp.]|nr:non-ribosomal peptide synthetase [Rhizomicrobium sp.]